VRPNVVVDIGNSRMKWGWCAFGQPITTSSAISTTDPGEWSWHAEKFPIEGRIAWAVASVNPPALSRFLEWATGRGDAALVIDHYRQLPIRVLVDEPEKVGIDRLLAAVAVHRRLPSDGEGIVIDVGTAMTVDLVTGEGFRGGAIVPGFQLMFHSLHEHTAKLPLLDEAEVFDQYPEIDPTPPGRTTANAIAAGVLSAVRGAAEVLVRDMTLGPSRTITVFFTGGGGGRLYDMKPFLPLDSHSQYDKNLVLEGIRLAAEALP